MDLKRAHFRGRFWAEASRRSGDQYLSTGSKQVLGTAFCAEFAFCFQLFRRKSRFSCLTAQQYFCLMSERRRNVDAHATPSESLAMTHTQPAAREMRRMKIIP